MEVAATALPVQAGGTAHLDYLDGWRGLAILLVLQGHFMVIPGWHSGRMGVDVFFCLSGLLMSRLLFQRRVPLGTFYKRRLSRILPAFLLYLGIVFTIAAAIGKRPRRAKWCRPFCSSEAICRWTRTSSSAAFPSAISGR